MRVQFNLIFVCSLLLAVSVGYSLNQIRTDTANTAPSADKDQEPPQNQLSEEVVYCPADARQCPDGSYVSRVAPNCEFAPCP